MSRVKVHRGDTTVGFQGASQALEEGAESRAERLSTLEDRMKTIREASKE